MIHPLFVSVDNIIRARASQRWRMWMNVGHKILYKLWMGIAVECRFIYPDIISRQGYAAVGLK